MQEQTSAIAVPYLITIPTTLLVNLLIIGEYSFNSPSSWWSNEHRDSDYSKVISWLGWAIVNYKQYCLWRIIIQETSGIGGDFHRG